jgi:cytochrome c oxidase cbb3-type subunit 3
MTPKLDHAVDGIEEYDNPLPAWWLYGFYLTILIAIVYSAVNFNFSQQAMWSQEMAAAQVRYPKPTLESQAARIPKLATDPEVLGGGAEIFRKDCAVCHGQQAEGKIGPCLTDDTWLYGGEPLDLLTSIDGGRPKGMPAWNKALGEKRCLEVASYVYSLTHQR